MPAALAVLLAAVLTASSARFEGVIHMRLTLESGSGNLALSLSGEAARLDMKVSVDPLPVPVTLSILHQGKDMRNVILIDDMQRAYSEVSLAEAGKLTQGTGKSRYTVKVLGQGKILGYAATHVTLSRDKEFVDAWIAGELKDAFAVLRTLQEANPQVGEAALFQALEEAGHGGLPMRFTVIREGQKVTTEVMKIERKALPASLFETPKGYRRTEYGAKNPQ